MCHFDIALEAGVSRYKPGVIDRPRLRVCSTQGSKIGHGAIRSVGNKCASGVGVGLATGKAGHLAKAVDVIGSAVSLSFQRSQVGGVSITENSGVGDLGSEG